MTNPNNAIGTNAAYSGRTSVNAFNDVLSVLSRGIISGWACSPSSGLTVVLGGDGTTRDVAVAEDNIGNKTTINNISGSPISVTIGAAPSTNRRIDLIVAYVDNPPEGSSSITDNYEACGLVVVEGTVASSPIAPDDSAIRTAITGEGASGATAYYVVLAGIAMIAGTTDIDSTLINQGSAVQSGIANQNIQNTTIESSKFALYAVNNAIRTEPNLEPEADTVAGWLNLFGKAGFYATGYSALKFTNQPTGSGTLYTYHGNNSISQIWHSSNGYIFSRFGSNTTWYPNSNGAFYQDKHIFSGTSDPSASLGQNGDVYIKYSS